MCGRFTLAAPGEVLAEVLGLDLAPALEPRYNIAPTQDVLVVRLEPSGRRLQSLRWGLVPRFWSAPKKGPLLLNARAESLGSTSAFKDAFARRRCLVPADGFFEWRKDPHGGKSQPHLVTVGDKSVFAMAGVFEPPHPLDPASSGTCAIITTEANALMADIHDRMPVILAPESYAAWLEPTSEARKDLAPLLRPFPPELMRAVRVGPAVNKASNDSPECLLPL